MKYQAVIFDYDYTLADSEIGIVTCFRLVLERHGVRGISDYEIKRTIGMPLADALELLMNVRDHEELKALRQEYVGYADIHMVKNTVLYAAAKPLLCALRASGCKVGILSSKTAGRIRATLASEKLEDAISSLIGISDVTCPKPDPEGLNRMIEFFNVKKENVLYVGDSLIDAATAKNAGVDFIGVLTGMTKEEEFVLYPRMKILCGLESLMEFLGVG